MNSGAVKAAKIKKPASSPQRVSKADVQGAGNASTGHEISEPVFDLPILRKAACACGGGCSWCRFPTSFNPQLKTHSNLSKVDERSRLSRAKAVTTRDGSPLEPIVRSKMERGFDADFSDVRVHSDQQAADAADSINARAYTIGKHIVFDKGQYEPGSYYSDHLIAHELTHVIQQSKTAPGKPETFYRGQLEKEADYAATNIIAGNNVHVSGSVGIGISRHPHSESEEETHWHSSSGITVSLDEPDHLLHHEWYDTTLDHRLRVFSDRGIVYSHGIAWAKYEHQRLGPSYHWMGPPQPMPDEGPIVLTISYLTPILSEASFRKWEEEQESRSRATESEDEKNLGGGGAVEPPVTGSGPTAGTVQGQSGTNETGNEGGTQQQLSQSPETETPGGGSLLPPQNPYEQEPVEDSRPIEPLRPDLDVLSNNPALSSYYLLLLEHYDGLVVSPRMREMAADGLDRQEVNIINGENLHRETISAFFTQGWNEFALNGGERLENFAPLIERIIEQYDRGNLNATANRLRIGHGLPERDILGIAHRNARLLLYDNLGMPMRGLTGIGWRDNGYISAPRSRPAEDSGRPMSRDTELDLMTAHIFVQALGVEDTEMVADAVAAALRHLDVVRASVIEGLAEEVLETMAETAGILIGFMAGHAFARFLMRSPNPFAIAVGVALELSLRAAGLILGIHFLSDTWSVLMESAFHISRITENEQGELTALSRQHIEAAAVPLRRLINSAAALAVGGAFVFVGVVNGVRSGRIRAIWSLRGLREVSPDALPEGPVVPELSQGVRPVAGAGEARILNTEGRSGTSVESPRQAPEQPMTPESRSPEQQAEGARILDEMIRDPERQLQPEEVDTGRAVLVEYLRDPAAYQRRAEQARGRQVLEESLEADGQPASPPEAPRAESSVTPPLETSGESVPTVPTVPTRPPRRRIVRPPRPPQEAAPIEPVATPEPAPVRLRESEGPRPNETGTQFENRVLDEAGYNRGENAVPVSSGYFWWRGRSRGTFNSFIRALRAHARSAGMSLPRLNRAVLRQTVGEFIRSRPALDAMRQREISALNRQIEGLREQIASEPAQSRTLQGMRRRLTELQEQLSDLSGLQEIGRMRPDLIEVWANEARAVVSDPTLRPGDRAHNLKTRIYVEILKDILGWEDVYGVDFRTPEQQTIID